MRSAVFLILLTGRGKECDLEKVWLFILNEVEGAQLAGAQEPEKILREMCRRYPDARIVLTLLLHFALHPLLPQLRCPEKERRRRSRKWKR